MSNTMTMIKKETFLFLEDLNDHNDRSWFQENKSRYDDAKNDIDNFAQALITEILQIDSTISKEISAKKCVLRIYRDVRFSKDKSPYKNYFGINIAPNGKGNAGAGYYIHLTPRASFVAGGYFMPQNEHLKAIRQEIDYNSDELKRIIEAKDFKNYFSGLNQDYKLKTTPKGYDINHPDIELLKLKSFTVSHLLDDDELMNNGAVEKIAKGLRLIHPLNVFLTQAIL